MVGLKFGLLTVTSRAYGNNRWLCRCDCGTEKQVRGDHLKSGKTISCGCERSKRSSERLHKLHEANTKTGLSKSRIYGIWSNMKQRCLNPKNHAWSYYGGRGIHVCDRWLYFVNFLSDMGIPTSGMTIERINNNGHYEPGNCRWATREDQQNNRRVNHLIEWSGKTQTLSKWAKELGLTINTFSERIYSGLPLAKAMTPGKLPLSMIGLTLGGKANGEKQRQKTHCKHGHPFSGYNLYIAKNGSRVCKKCRANRMIKYKNSRDC